MPEHDVLGKDTIKIWFRHNHCVVKIGLDLKFRDIGSLFLNKGIGYNKSFC